VYAVPLWFAYCVLGAVLNAVRGDCGQNKKKICTLGNVNALNSKGVAGERNGREAVSHCGEMRVAISLLCALSFGGLINELLRWVVNGWKKTRTK